MQGIVTASEAARRTTAAVALMGGSALLHAFRILVE
jgi:hypothetical protein